MLALMADFFFLGTALIEKLGSGIFVVGYVAVTGLYVVTLILMSNVVYDCYEVAASFVLHPLVTIDLLVGFFQQEEP